MAGKRANGVMTETARLGTNGTAAKRDGGARGRAESERERETEEERAKEEESARWDVQAYLRANNAMKGSRLASPRDASSPALPVSTLSGLPPFPIAPHMLQSMSQTNPFWAAQAMLHHGVALRQNAPLGQVGATTNVATDELTQKRLQRKQSNRDSARRSRLRKQAETVEINVKVSELEREVTALREENQRLKKRLAENDAQRERKITK